jgi:hypothetical protein
MYEFLLNNAETICTLITSLIVGLVARSREKSRLRKEGILRDKKYTQGK